MKKQLFAVVASGLLLASGMSFAQNNDQNNQPAAGTTGSNTGTQGKGTFTPGKIAVTAAIVGGAIAATTDSGGGSGSGSTTTTTTTP